MSINYENPKRTKKSNIPIGSLLALNNQLLLSF